jgi:hypothetical protein
MSGWDRDAIDLIELAFIEFGAAGTGENRFIAVQGWLDSRPARLDSLKWSLSWENTKNVSTAPTHYKRKYPVQWHYLTKWWTLGDLTTT